MTLIDIGLTALGVVPLLAGAYLVVLTLAWRRPLHAVAPRAPMRLVVVVPAHDEARGIGATVRSLLAARYPAADRRVVVIADNCTDETAQVARTAGADVLVRIDPDRRGKGHALRFGIDRLLAEAAERPWDALAVVDADSDVSPGCLEALAARLAAGAQAAQATYLPRRTGSGPTSVLTDVAFFAFHVVRSGARERLRLSCGLRGNGMAFRRELLAQVPHAAFSRTEDLEFGVQLGLAGVRVAYAGDALVRGDMPEHHAAVSRQRERWIGGRADIVRRYVPTLIREAIVRRSPMLADLAVDALVPPVSALVVACGAGLVASLVVAMAGGRLTYAVATWGAASIAVSAHVAHAAWHAGLMRPFLRAARSVPAYALHKCAIALRSLVHSDDRWLRTQREGELS